MSEWLAANWEYVLVAFYAIEKIVKLTPSNYDVILFCVNHSSYKRIKKENFSKNAIYFDLNQVLNNSQINFMNKNNFKLEILGGNY